MKKMKIHPFSLLLLAVLLLPACAKAEGPKDPSQGDQLPYQQIDQETAKAMMAVDDGHVVVDVRRH